LGGAGGVDVEQLSRRVDRLVRVRGGSLAASAVPGEKYQPGEVGVHGARDCGRQCHRGDQLTGRQCRRPFGPFVSAAEQDGRHRNRFGDRTGNAPPAQPLERDHQIRRVRLDTVELLRHRERGDAEVGQRGPDLAARRGVTLSPGPYGGGDVGRRQRGVDAGGEVTLLFVECEFHFASQSSLGQPEHPLGDDVALNLVGARVDRATECEQQPIGPGVGQFGVGPAQFERTLVQRHVEVAPEHLGHRRLRTQFPPSESRVTVPKVCSR
jgi:hypothetical protein